jgi:hypothetical protein
VKRLRPIFGKLAPSLPLPQSYRRRIHSGQPGAVLVKKKRR